MKIITTDASKLELVGKLVKENIITFEEGLKLLEVEAKIEGQTLPGARPYWATTDYKFPNVIKVNDSSKPYNPIIYPNPNPPFPAFSNGEITVTN